MKTRLRLVLRNPFGLAGIALGLVSVGNILLFTLIDLIGNNVNPYIGILGYIVAPGFLLLSLISIGFGFWIEHRKVAAEAPGEVGIYPRLDLNRPEHRSAALALFTFLVVFVAIS